MVLGKLLGPGRPTDLDYSREGLIALAVCAGGMFGHFFSRLSFFSSFFFSLVDGPKQTEILSQRTVKPKTTNQPNHRKKKSKQKLIKFVLFI